MSKSIGPELPPHLQKLAKPCSSEDSSGDDNEPESPSIGPTLPPHLLKPTSPAPDLYGPALPPNFGVKTMGPTLPPGVILPKYDYDESDDDVIGPSLNDLVKPGEADGNIEADIEKRANTMKDKLLGKDIVDEAPQREEWMTELPNIMGNKIGLSLGPRKFNKKAAPSIKESDRAGWTETPNTEKPSKSKEDEEEEKPSIEEMLIRKRNLDTSKNLEEFNKKNRKDSLVDIHKKSRKKKKDDSKEKRREFDRDKDLSAGKIDTALAKNIADRAKMFNTKFSHGSNHYL